MKTILVVDDENVLVETLTELLEFEGYHVVTAGNGKDGLAQWVKEDPDLVLTDLMMPFTDGLQMVRVGMVLRIVIEDWIGQADRARIQRRHQRNRFIG